MSPWDRIDILDWMKLLADKPLHAGDLVAWLWLRRCDEEDADPVVEATPRPGDQRKTSCTTAAIDVASWLRFLTVGELVAPVAEAEHPYASPTGALPTLMVEKRPVPPPEPTPPPKRGRGRPPKVVVVAPPPVPPRNPLAWTWRLLLPTEEMQRLWLDGTVHIEMSPWEERRADRARWHNRYRRSQRLLPGASVIET